MSNPDFFWQIVSTGSMAVAVYVGIRVDLARLHERLDNLRERVDLIDSRGCQIYNPHRESRQ